MKPWTLLRYWHYTVMIYMMSIGMISCSNDKGEADPELHLNDIQVIGSHNSYKLAIEQPLLDYIKQAVGDALAETLEYEHLPLHEQLDLGLRNLELDVFYDPEGGRYTEPLGLRIMTESGHTPLPFDQEGRLEVPGLKLFHVQDVDFRSHHLLFTDGLKAIKSWSDAHDDHTPIFVLINAQDEEIEGTLSPLPFTAEAMESIDVEIKRVFEDDQLISPDQVRGAFESLETAVLTNGWPTLDESRGKILFILDENASKTARYISRFPGLVNASMFVNLPEGNPEAAFMIINDPIANGQLIEQMVGKGYMVRTLADSETHEARINNLSRFANALASGAQVISTDYYIPSSLFSSSYQVIFENGNYERIRDR